MVRLHAITGGTLLGVWMKADQTQDKALIIVERKSSTMKAADKKDGFMWFQWQPRSESHSGMLLRAREDGHATCERAQVPARTLCSRRIACFILTLTLMAANAVAQANSAAQQPTAPNENDSLKVNSLDGAFVPRSVPLKPLTPPERWKLYLRTTYTTYGIYIKTGIFTLSDQIRNVPPEWGKTPGGFGKRLGTREAQFVIQNSLTAAGNAALGWEPRYDRCRCAGFWPRTWHAINRNFVTYGGPNQSTRPQIMPYAGAFGAAAASASWQPNNPSVLIKGYQGAVTQVAVGIGVNWLAEFAPEIKRVLRRPPGPD